MDEVAAVLNYAKSILGIEYEITMLREQVKDIKSDAKNDGVSIKSVNAAISRIKKELSTTIDEKTDIEDMESIIKDDPGVMKVIRAIVDK